MQLYFILKQTELKT